MNHETVIKLLSDLPGADFNSLLLEVFNQRTAKISPPDLLQNYRRNRFVQPATLPLLQLLELERSTLELLQQRGFEILHLSPLAPLGTCSVFGCVNQKKVVSAARNTEVLADATNSIALFIADKKQAMKAKGLVSPDFHCCTTQRHVRAQALPSKLFTAHFTIACLVSAGRDPGSFSFECNSLTRHVLAWKNLLNDTFGIPQISLRLIPRAGYRNRGLVAELTGTLEAAIPGITIETLPRQDDNNYYKGFQFKVVIDVNGEPFEIADGGMVDWTQQLLADQKERMLISGFGLELLSRLNASA